MLDIGLSLSSKSPYVGSSAFDPLSLFESSEYGTLLRPARGSGVLFQETSSPSTASGVGDPVGWVADESGNDKDGAAFDDDGRPTLQADGALRFDGTDDGIKVGFGDTEALAAPHTVVICFNMLVWVSLDTIIGNGGVRWLDMITTTPRLRLEAGAEQFEDFVEAETHVLTIKVNGASSSWQVDDASPNTYTSADNSLGSFIFGARTQAGANAAEIDLYEALVIDRILTSDETDDYVGALMDWFV